MGLDALRGGRCRRRTERLALAPVDFGIAREPIEPRPCDRVIAAEYLEDRFGPDPVELVACGRVSIRVDEEVDAVVRRRIAEHATSRRRKQVERVVIQETRVMVDRHVRIGCDRHGVEHRHGGPISERPVNHDPRRRSRDGNEQEPGDQNREERCGSDCGIADAFRRNGNANLLPPRADGSRPA